MFVDLLSSSQTKQWKLMAQLCNKTHSLFFLFPSLRPFFPPFILFFFLLFSIPPPPLPPSYFLSLSLSQQWRQVFTSIIKTNALTFSYNKSEKQERLPPSLLFIHIFFSVVPIIPENKFNKSSYALFLYFLNLFQKTKRPENLKIENIKKKNRIIPLQ